MTLEFREIKNCFQEVGKPGKLASFTFRNEGVSLCFTPEALHDIYYNTKKAHLTFEKQEHPEYTSYVSSTDRVISKADVVDPYTEKSIAELFDGIDAETIRAEFNKALSAAGADKVYGDCRLTAPVKKPQEDRQSAEVYYPNFAHA